MAFIEMKDIRYKIKSKGSKDRQLFQDLSLSFDNHEMLALVGPNGCGKTTLTKMMMGILSPDQGSVSLDGKDVSSCSRAYMGSRIGYLFQNPIQQLFCQTVEEELLFAERMKGPVSKQIEVRYEKVVDELSLRHVLGTPVFHLSQGEQQRLAIGTLLMREPDFLILDEPTSGLDSERKQALGKQLLELKDQGIGMMIVTHDHEFINGLPAKVLTLDGGQLVDE